MDAKHVLVAVLLAVVAILAKGTWDRNHAAPPAAPSTSAPASTGGAAPTGAAPRSGAASAACDLAPTCGSDPDVLCQIERNFPGTVPPEDGAKRPPAANQSLRVLLASLPSPEEPLLATDFDRGIEAIERALQSQGYVPQRRRLPWRENATGKPGWLLFRRDNQAANQKVSLELLLVLVVSERPGSGIDRAELQGALAQMKAISERVPTDGDTKLVFLGPYYSGAAQSLVQQTRGWCTACGAGFCSARSLVAVSGTATRRRTKAIVEGLKGVFKDSSFAATVLPDDLLVAGMHRFIEQQLEVPASEIADLTETSTDYGNAVAIGDHPDAGAALKIALPLHVSVLARPKADASKDASPLAKSTQIELDDTFSTLARNGINHVGVLTTATSEKVFIVSRLRESAPNLRVHVYESSVELADRSPEGKSLEGLMVASSYPVFAESQLWHRPAAPLVQFPSDATEGIYNAVLGLLARYEGGLRQPLPDVMLDYLSPFCREVPGPSVWISVSITGQLWPLAVYGQALAANPNVNTCQAVAIDGYLLDPTPPGVAATTTGEPALPVHASFLTLLGALVALGLVVGNAIGFSPLGRKAAWRALLVSSDESAGRGSPLPAGGPRHDVAMLGLWVLAITAMMMGKVLDLPGAFPAHTASDPVLRALARLLIAGAFVLVVGACVLSIRRCRDAENLKERKRRLLSAAIQVVMCLVMLAGIILLPRASVGHPDGHAYFFFVRATDPGIGLTPTIPLFMVGMTIYGATLLRLIVIRRSEGLRAEAAGWNPQPPRDGTRQSLSSCAVAMEQFATAASRSLLPACMVGTLVGAVVLYLTPLRLGSLEGRGFDAGCSICFALIFTLTLAAAWRAHSLWFRLRDFTRALAIHPAVASLARLPTSVAERFRSPVPGQVGNEQIDVALCMTLQALGTGAPAIADLLSELHVRWFPLTATSPAAPAATPAGPSGGPPPPLQRRSREELQEDFLALHMAAALGLMCDATRTMLFIATGTGLVAMLACALYPFQPAASLTVAGLASVGLVVVVALRVLLGIERDKVLSDVAGTTPGAVTPSLGLFTRLVGYVVVPLGGLIGSRLQDPGSVIELLRNMMNALSR